MAAEDKRGTRWHEKADGLYVSLRPNINGYPVIMKCSIPGTRPDQASLLPLEVAVSNKGLGGEDSALSGQMVSALARYMRDLLECGEKVTVPDGIFP